MLRSLFENLRMGRKMNLDCKMKTYTQNKMRRMTHNR